MNKEFYSCFYPKEMAENTARFMQKSVHHRDTYIGEKLTKP